MDGREDMGMASYYTHRGIGGGMRSITNQNPSLVAHHFSADIFGGGSVVESSPPAISHHGVADGVSKGEPPVKRKRGRPRKYGPPGTTALAVSPMCSSPSASAVGSIASCLMASETKRGRGRPRGSGRKQQLASLGEWVCGSAGMAFTPHILAISMGEDIAEKILSIAQQGPRAVCVLSANGAASTVTLRQPAASGGTVTYEGRFEILSLSGCFLICEEEGGSHSRTGGLSISLSSPDSRVIGGGVGGSLIAASNVQVVVGSFLYGGSKTKNKNKVSQSQDSDSELKMDMKSTPSAMGVWPVSRQMEMRDAHIEIDLTRG